MLTDYLKAEACWKLVVDGMKSLPPLQSWEAFLQRRGSGARALLLQFFPLNQGASKGERNTARAVFQALLNQFIS